MTVLTVDAVEQLTRRVQEFSLQQSQQDLFEYLQKEVSAARKQAEEILSIAQVLSATALGDDVTVDLAELKDSVAGVREHLKEWSPRELRDSGEVTRLRTAVEDLQSHLSGEAHRRWREHMDANPVPRIGDLAKLLDRLGIEPRLVLVIRNALRRLDAATELTYPTVEEFEKYNDDLEKATEGASRIGLEASWPPNVIMFFQQAAERGAPLASLTDDVKDWLVEHGYERYFRIVPVSD
jgi:hypothetical protein